MESPPRLVDLAREAAMADYLAREIKVGAVTRMAAINIYRKYLECEFMTAILAIDMAIGKLNAGKE
jgi:hypothetical protein